MIVPVRSSACETPKALTHTSRLKGERSLAIDLLRGLAVSMVMLAHLPFSRSGLTTESISSVYPRASISDLLAHGHYGVQLFLVISGYCIHTRWARQRDRGAKVDFVAFWKRRLTRLYPPYVFVLFLSVAITVVASRLFPGSGAHVSPEQLTIDLIVLLLLMQNLTDASARVGNPPFWSLALEEQLYFLYFPLLAMRRARGWRFASGVALAVTIGWLAIGKVVPASWQLGWYRAGPAYWFAWTLGAIAAESHLGLLRLPRFCRSAISFVLVAAFGALCPRPFRDLFVTVSFFFLLMAVIEVETVGLLHRVRWLAPLVRLGGISYGVYLVHNIAFVVAKRFLMNRGLPLAGVLILRLIAGVAAGYVIYLAIERPFLRRSQRVPVPVRGKAHDRHVLSAKV